MEFQIVDIGMGGSDFLLTVLCYYFYQKTVMIHFQFYESVFGDIILNYSVFLLIFFYKKMGEKQ